MKKAGAIATRLGVHSDTIRDWADLFEEFFSEGARRGAGIRRVFSLEDEVILNTVCELRKQNVEFEEIRARLTNGERIEALPVINEPVPPDSAIELFGKIKILEATIEQKNELIAELRAEIEAERRRTEQAIERAHSMPPQEVIALHRKIAVLEYQLEQIQSQRDDKQEMSDQ
ncbi:MAG: MerR family transcriptional regulator [Anaerolineae bacterium]|nr:MerR family transcriptional regulator [Anaerolineae bacterium]